MSPIGCDFNRSMQHLSFNYKAEDVVNEATTENLLHRDRQSIDVGPLAIRKVRTSSKYLKRLARPTGFEPVPLPSEGNTRSS